MPRRNPQLLIASSNQGKVAEIRALLRDIPVTLLTPGLLNARIQVDETGGTYLENALLKGQAFAEHTGLLTLADDSGLEVDTLKGLPGIQSARFSPKPGATDADRREHLLGQLAGHPRPWTARFRCVVVLVSPDGTTHSFAGQCQGEIIEQERGEGGFGYDPIFYIPELESTMAELSMEQKNRISHRARAIRYARPTLITLIEQAG